jgi:hypothetical protein
MSALAEFQFEIVPSVDATDGVIFGIGAGISLNADGFHPGSTDWATQDVENASNGTTGFGRDRLLGPTWAWDLHINQEDLSTARTALAEFSTAWRALHIREDPGAKVAIRYRLDDEYRRIFGRPRRNDASPNNLILGGMIPFGVDFKCVDGFVYDDEESTATLAPGNSGDPIGGGFTFPIALPISGLPSTSQEVPIVVGGDAPTNPRIRFYGPWTSPSLSANGWTLSMPEYVIPSGQFVEIDTRPWACTVMLNGTTSVAGALARRQSIPAAKLQPGVSDLEVSGFSTSGGYCQLWWRNAWNSF